VVPRRGQQARPVPAVIEAIAIGEKLMFFVTYLRRMTILAVVLAVAGGLLAGVLGSWRIAGLRPADALARVA
jgi:putative ABC transport system permease protein